MRPKSLDHDARDPATILGPFPPPVLPEILRPHISVFHLRLPVRWLIPSRVFDVEEDISGNSDHFVVDLSVHLLLWIRRNASGDVLRDYCSL
jgi:hypothetical protein